jgi:hypothetical protein
MSAKVIPLHGGRAEPPLMPADPPGAAVIRLPVRKSQPELRRNPPASRRRGRKGHHADCPYADDRNPDTCCVCQSIRKGAKDDVDTRPTPVRRSADRAVPDPVRTA